MSLRWKPELSHAFGQGTGGTTVVVSAVARARVAIYRLIVTNNQAAAATLVIQDTTGVALSQTFQLGITPAMVLDLADNQDPWWVTNPGVGVQLVQGTGTNTIAWDIYYLQQVMPYAG